MSTELAIPEDMMAKLAARAKAAAAAERPSLGTISTQAGQLKFNGQAVPGSKLEAVVLTAVYRNVWYAGRFDRNSIVAPNCFSLSTTDGAMVPDPSVRQKPAATCDECPHGQWESDPNGGKGKACKQSRRLIIMPADAIAKGPDAVRDAELAKFDVPVTSVKNYSTFVNVLAASAGVPPEAAVTEITATPDPKTQVKVHFKPVRVLPSLEILEAVERRIDFAQRLALEPYEDTAVIDDDEPAPSGAPAAAGKGAAKAKKY